MKKPDIEKMDNMDLIYLLCINHTKETKTARKEEKICIETLWKRGIVNKETMLKKFDIE
ncbi:hypothetical protein [Konateibacter massiliensis]|uniref:hypothetical protein n=1 Tax=Konateibacter massiliensis TaxID=2002841 RepID=UPI0015D49B37|nr:hypothetical protein [Konateibacter massiliensis]